MMTRQKLLIMGVLVILFFVVLLNEFYTTPHQFPKESNVLTYDSLSAVNDTVKVEHWESSYQVSNSDEIQKMIKEEINELRKFGVELNINTDTTSTTFRTSPPEKNSTINNATPIVKKVHPTTNTNQTFVTVRTPETAVAGALSAKALAIENDTYPLPQSAFCQSEVFLLILVISKATSFKRRDNIRDSWAFSYEDDYEKLKNRKSFPNQKTFLPKNVVKTVFVVGKSKEDGIMEKVLEESSFTKDIVFGSLMEDYRNLTLKTKLALKWAAYACKSTFILKTDDDVFVNPVVLVEWLKGMPQQNLYTGWCNFNSPVIRNKNHKWYVSYDDYKENRFPGYCLGGGYLMSEDVLLKVVQKSYGRKLFPMEDLYVGLLMKELGVEVRNEKQHFNLVYSGKTVSDCRLNDLFLAHQVLGKNLINHIKQARVALQSC